MQYSHNLIKKGIMAGETKQILRETLDSHSLPTQFSENQVRIDELDRLEVHADLPHLLDYVLRRYEELEK